MEKHSIDEILVHDETNLDLAHIIANWTSHPELPEPIGVIYSVDKPTYNQDMVDQINFAKEKKEQSARPLKCRGHLESILDYEYPQERDSIGTVQVPSSKYYGAQTQRSLENFKISEEKFPREFIRAYGIIKKQPPL